MLVFLALLPWLVLVGALPVVLRRRPALESYAPERAAAAPFVSVIVPVRDDAGRIGACLASLLDTEHRPVEVVVVDAGSRDGTREIVEALERRAPARVRLVAAGPGPSGWPWRAWACERGSREARGDLLLFTEPGSHHDAELLPRAIAALERERADLLSVLPRLTMEGFWERLVMPHIWFMLVARFPSAARVNRTVSPRGAVASHQFMLFRRAAYEASGGHAVMEPGALEDVRIAQAVVGAGLRLFLVHGENYLETRMYRTLRTIAGDWPSAVAPASPATVAPWAGAFVPWVLVALPLALFVVPAALLAAGLFYGPARTMTDWSAAATLLSLAFWLAVHGRFRIRPAYAMVYPAGALLTSVLFVRSILRRDREGV